MDRFYCLSVDPIHKRRGDVLYYLFQKFPEVIQSLQPYQVLALLAYNWPGNVREIERVGQCLKMKDKVSWLDPSESGLLSASDFLFPVTIRTSLNRWGLQGLEHDLKKYGIPIRKLETELNSYGLGIISNPDNFTPAFKKDLNPIKLQDEEIKFGIECYKIDAFERARTGFAFYCNLFRQDKKENRDLADVSKWTDWPEWAIPDIEDKYVDLSKEILGFLRSSKTFAEGAISAATESRNVFNMTLEELQRYYFNSLLNLKNSKIKAVAKQAGLPENTCRDKLKKLGLRGSKATNN